MNMNPCENGHVYVWSGKTVYRHAAPTCAGPAFESRAEARNAALEEAARVCETEADAYLHCGEGPKAEASLRCARLIRAAKEADDE